MKDRDVLFPYCSRYYYCCYCYYYCAYSKHAFILLVRTVGLRLLSRMFQTLCIIIFSLTLAAVFPRLSSFQDAIFESLGSRAYLEYDYAGISGFPIRGYDLWVAKDVKACSMICLLTEEWICMSFGFSIERQVCLTNSNAFGKVATSTGYLRKPTCTKNFHLTRDEKRCLSLETKAVNWSEARRTCNSQMSHPAAVLSHDYGLLVKNFVDSQREIFTNSCADNNIIRIWIGLTRPEGSSQFQWIPYKNSNFSLGLDYYNLNLSTNWSIGNDVDLSNPNSSKAALCAAVLEDGTWEAVDCSKTFCVLCEKELGSYVKSRVTPLRNLSAIRLPNFIPRAHPKRGWSRG